MNKVFSFLIFSVCLVLMSCNSKDNVKPATQKVSPEKQVENPIQPVKNDKIVEKSIDAPIYKPRENDNIKRTSLAEAAKKKSKKSSNTVTNPVTETPKEKPKKETETVKPKVKPTKKSEPAPKTESKVTAQPKIVNKPRASTNNPPKINFGKINHNFGNIEMGDEFDVKFEFKNTGGSPLEIMKVDVSCGCTEPSFPFIPIDPGDKGYIGIHYNSTGKLGKQNPEIRVLTNISEEPFLLTLNGVVFDRDPNKSMVDTTKLATKVDSTKSATKKDSTSSSN